MPTKEYGAIAISEDIDMDSMLEKLPLEMRNKAARKAVKADTNVVMRTYRARARRGKTGNLRRSIKTLVRAYQQNTIWYGLAGHIKPTGNHAHLIEQGHKIYRRGPIGDSAKGKQLTPISGPPRVEGAYDLVSAIDTTKSKRDRAVLDSLAESIKKAGG